MSKPNPANPVDAHGNPFPPGKSPIMEMPHGIIERIAQEVDTTKYPSERNKNLGNLCQSARGIHAFASKVLYQRVAILHKLPENYEKYHVEYECVRCLKIVARLLRTCRSAPGLANLVHNLALDPPGETPIMDYLGQELRVMVRDVVRQMFPVNIVDNGRPSGTMTFLALILSLPELTTLYLKINEYWRSTNFLLKPGRPELPPDLLKMTKLSLVADSELRKRDLGVRLQLFNGLLHRLPALESLYILAPRHGEALTCRLTNLRTLKLELGHLSYKGLRVLLRDCSALKQFEISHDIHSQLNDNFMPVSPSQVLECLDRARCRDLEQLQIHTWLPPAPIPAPPNPYYPKRDYGSLNNNSVDNMDIDRNQVDRDVDMTMEDIDRELGMDPDSSDRDDNDNNDNDAVSMSSMSSLISSIHSDDDEDPHLKVRPYPHRPVPANEFSFLGEYRRPLRDIAPNLRALSIDYNMLGWSTTAGNNRGKETRNSLTTLLDGLAKLETLSLFNVLLDDRLMEDLSEFMTHLPYNALPKLRRVVIQTPRDELNIRWRRHWRPAQNWTVGWTGVSRERWRPDGRWAFKCTVAGRVWFRLYCGGDRTEHYPDVDYGRRSGLDLQEGVK